MQRIDLVIAGIAILALAGSLLGVALYDEPEFRRYDVRVVEESGTQQVYTGTVTGPGDEDHEDWPFDVLNVTGITFEIEISGNIALREPNTQVLVRITGPQDQTDEVTLSLSGTGLQSESGRIEFDEDDLNPMPEGKSRVLARNAAEALQDDEVQEAIPVGHNGIGGWMIHVEIVQGGAIMDPLLGTPVQEESVGVTITANYTHYSSRAQVHLPDPGPVA